ncbi:FecR family protein [Marinibacterium profundimaris]|uniref:FecR protein domain-containing protein n=1 Tax=Marinibacterium profundimaris TaxID=1679460 RepID=A0A225NGP4_9RHOB|nr:FecR domain-containing protein [Marinibacterium profundimaris]OWU72828.1 hypothetical protein ATO3_14050 [Marinibacterium profundimaris]
MPVGQVEKISGPATVPRADGTVEPLNVGVKIFQNDVLSTGPGGTLSTTFADGTTFSLAPDSRMVINQLGYSPGGGNDTGKFDLIQGGFVFIAGQVAKTGDMDVTTPAATMGIRGTNVSTQIFLENGSRRSSWR